MVRLRLYLFAVILVFGFLLFGCLDFFGLGTPSKNDSQVNKTICTTEYRPVCGKDGKTYSNACFAKNAKIEITSEGECASGSCSDTDFGRDVFVKGIINNGRTNFTDSCLNASAILEYYCAYSQISNQTINCPEAYECQDGTCVRSGLQPPQPNITRTARCIDTDGGISYFVKGSVSESGSVREDVCASFDIVKEYYCQNDTIVNSNYQCPSGYRCENGRCISSSQTCTDSDGGRNYERRGTAITQLLNLRSTYQDECINSDTLREYSCNDGQLETERTTCRSGYRCEEGACIALSSSSDCRDSDSADSVYVRGTVSKTGRSPESDRCTGANTGIEFYCSNNEIASRSFSCPSEYICSEGFCVAQVSSNTTPPTPASCIDNPNRNDLTRQGTTSNSTTSRTDSCTSDGRVVKYSCSGSGSAIIDQTLSCPSGRRCENGACVVIPPPPGPTCTDTDGGNVLNIRGTVSDGRSSETDNCPSGDGTQEIKEFNCDGNTIQSAIRNCPSGQLCRQGACEAMSCVDNGVDPVTADRATITFASGTGLTVGDRCLDNDQLEEAVCNYIAGGSLGHAPAISCRSTYGPAFACRGSPAACSPICIDTDGGRVPTIAGGATRGSEALSSDSCMGSTAVKEYYCEGGEGGSVTSEIMPCDEGFRCRAVDGIRGEACMVFCENLDGDDNNPFIGGRTRYGAALKIDACGADGDSLTEWYCDSSGTLASRPVSCRAEAVGSFCVIRGSDGAGYCA